MKSTKSRTTADIAARIEHLKSENEMLGNVEVSGVINAARQADIDANKKEIARLRQLSKA